MRLFLDVECGLGERNCGFTRGLRSGATVGVAEDHLNFTPVLLAQQTGLVAGGDEGSNISDRAAGRPLLVPPLADEAGEVRR